jgi:hypothetical protein
MKRDKRVYCKGVRSMGTDQICRFSRVGMGCRFLTVLMLSLLLQIQGTGMAAENPGVPEAAGEDLIYMMELDALKLNGTVTGVRDWNARDDNWLSGDYFEPYVLSIDVRNHGGECFGTHDFYVKKGIALSGVKSGTVIVFHINKNMCHPNKALIIMDLQVMP